MRFIDLSTWNRTAHYQAFRNRMQPQYGITFDLDITDFLQGIRGKGYSFTFAFIYAVTSCANQIEAFRCRIVDGKPAVYDVVNTSFTYLGKGAELYKVVYVPMRESMEEYVKLARETEERQTTYFPKEMRDDIYQFSPNPWVSYRHISHTDSGDRDNAIPLFDWGKFYEKDGKILLPFSVQVHHAFVDGIHIGKLAELLQSYLSEFQ